MAAASVLVGLFTGILAFVTALVTGQGFISAAGYYVVGGFIGSTGLVLIALTRAVAEEQLRRIPVIVRG